MGLSTASNAKPMTLGCHKKGRSDSHAHSRTGGTDEESAHNERHTHVIMGGVPIRGQSALDILNMRAHSLTWDTHDGSEHTGRHPNLIMRSSSIRRQSALRDSRHAADERQRLAFSDPRPPDPPDILASPSSGSGRGVVQRYRPRSPIF